MSVECARSVFVDGSVEDLSAGGVSLLAEIKARSMLHLFEEYQVFVAQEPRRDRVRSLGLLCPRESRGNQAGDESSTQQLSRATSRDVKWSRRTDTH